MGINKILGGIFTVFVFFLYLVSVPVFAQTASSIPAPVLSSAACSALPRASISWSGQPTNNPSSWCNGGFIIDVSTSSDFSGVYNKCVPANIQAASYSTTVPDGFNPGFILQSGLTYYVRVNNGLLSNTRSFTCPATSTPATPTPTPIPTPSPIPIATRTPSPIPTPVPTSILTPTISPILNPIVGSTGPTSANPSPSTPPITITRITTDINGQTITLSNNFAQPVHLPVSDLTRASDVPVKIDVTYSDGTTRSFYLTFHYDPKLNPKQQINSSDIPVDVIIHKSLTNQDEVANWAKDTINNYINTRFSNANIKFKLRVDQVIMNSDDQKGCPAGSIKKLGNCVFSDNGNKIIIWLYKNGSAGIRPTSAGIEINQVWFNIPAYGDDPLSELDKRTLTHEIGHLFKMPDYYKEDVRGEDNLLTPGIGITAYVKDIMWSSINYDFFSETSKGFADRITSFPPGLAPGFPNSSWHEQYIPKSVVLKITDNNNPTRGAFVEVFPQTYRDPFHGGPPEIISPDVITVKGTTNDKGEINLGSYSDIFQHTIPVASGNLTIKGNSAYIRITYNNQKRYASLTLSYLNDLYFKGYTDTAVLDLFFESLSTYGVDTTRKALSAPGQVSTVPSLSEQERQLLEEHIKQDLPTPAPTSIPTPYDLNGDGGVNSVDVSIFIQILQPGKYDAKADFNHDNVINSADYSLLLKNFK